MADIAQGLFIKFVNVAKEYPLQTLVGVATLWPATYVIGPMLIATLQPLLRAVMPYLITALLLAAVGIFLLIRPLPTHGTAGMAPSPWRLAGAYRYRHVCS